VHGKNDVEYDVGIKNLATSTCIENSVIRSEPVKITIEIIALGEG
jgi:hypothetical protein